MPTKQNKTLILKNNSSFRSCISKISNTFIDYVDYLDILMPMYNLLECSDNYYMTSKSLWNYYNDDSNEKDDAGNYRINNKKSKYFE